MHSGRTGPENGARTYSDTRWAEMNPVTRRIFLKPSGMTEEQARRFSELLSAALVTQQQLAEQTPYILSPTGALVETELGFEFEHEPAIGVSVPDLFNPQSPPMPVEQLMQACTAMVYALRLSHGTNASVHGGICPGVLVRDPAGLWKLTDFGFAPAVLSVFEADAFLNLAVGASPAHPTASGVWEILGDPEVPRDERVWSFVDPNRYAQALKAGGRHPARFDPISDVTSMGFVLYILADRVHPYLKAIGAEEEFRIASYWDMLHTGRPRDIVRKDLLADPETELFDWWKNFVPKAIERKPEARKTTEELAVRLERFAPPVDATKLLEARRNAEANRWLAQLESSIQSGDWAAAETLLGMPPVFAPPDAQARITAARETVTTHKKATVDAERERAERADWTAWLDGIQTHVDSSDWDEAADTLKQRRDRGIAACPEDLRGRWQSLTATVRAAREEKERALELQKRTDRAREWVTDVRAAADAADVPRALDLTESIPDTDGCEAELVEEVQSLASWAADLRSAIEADHAAIQTWLAGAEAEAGRRRWQEAVDLLDHPPEVSHLPEGHQNRVDQLRATWTQRLASLGDERRAAAEALVHGLVAECAKRRLAEFVQPNAIDTRVKSIRDDESADPPRTHVEFAVAWVQAAARQSEPMGEFECSVGFDGAEPRLLSDAAQLTGAIAAALSGGIAERQREALQAWLESLNGTFLAGASCGADIPTPFAKLPVSLNWSTDAASAVLNANLTWHPQSQTWQPVKEAAALAELAIQCAANATACVEPALTKLLPALSAWRSFIEISAPKPPSLNWDRLPPELRFNIPVTIKPRGGKPEPFVTSDATMTSPVTAEVAIDGRSLKTAVESLLMRQRKASIAQIGAEIQAHLKKSSVSIKSVPEPRVNDDAAVWTLAAKGGKPLAISASWKNDLLAFVLPSNWQQLIDEYQALIDAKTPDAPAPQVAQPAAQPEAPAKPPAPKAQPPADKPKPEATKPAKPPPAKAAPDPTPAVASTPAAKSDTAPASKRRAQIGIAVAAGVAVIGGTIAWMATRSPKPEPVVPPDPIATTVPVDVSDQPLLAEWRAAMTEATRLISLNKFEDARAILGAQLERGPVPAELRNDLNRLQSTIADGIAVASKPPVSTEPTETRAWPEGWESGKDLPTMVSELADNLWQFDYGPAVPNQRVPASHMAALPDDLFRIDVADRSTGLPVLTGAIRRSGNVPIAVELNEESRRELARWLADRVLTYINADLSAGNLASVLKWKPRLDADALFKSPLLDDAARRRAQTVAAAIPPAWSPRTGFTSGQIDMRCGYPTSLVETTDDKRTFKLIWTHAGDAALWSLADAAIKSVGGTGRRDLETALLDGANPIEKPIRIFYIETTASDKPPAPVNLPRVAEWFIAAAKDATIRDGAKIWCSGGWACGSAEVTLSGNRPVRIPALPQNESGMVEWLKNPLTCQQRDPNEKLVPPIARYRRVIPIWPPR